MVVLRADETVLVGEPAERRSVTEAARTAREFKRRLGDPTPFLLGGTPYGAEALTGHLLREIVEKVAEQLGDRPSRVVLTHPASYGEYKRGYLEEAARLAGVGAVEFVPEPVAAAVHYTASERVAVGELLGVYDFGGGTLDIAVVRATAGGFELAGTPEGMERFGGVDLDEAIFFHVRESLGDALAGVAVDDPAWIAALAMLRGACTEAKEALSADTDTTIPVMLPTVHTEVRITRAEFEDMLRPRLRETVGVLERAIGSAGATYEDVSRILLVGGASRIPLVAEMIRRETGRPVAVNANPKHAVCMGAARLGMAEPVTEPIEESIEAAPQSPVEPVPAAEIPSPEPPSEVATDEGPFGGLPPDDDLAPSGGRLPRKWVRWAAAALAVVALAVAGVVVFGLGSSDEPGAAATFPDVTEPVPTDAVINTTPLGLLYYTGFRNAELDGEWGQWEIAEAVPPVDLAADYYPDLGPYSGLNPEVRAQHWAWIESTGAEVLFVTWSGLEFGDRDLLEIILEEAHNTALAVVPVIDLYPGRSPESVAADLELVAVELRDHPAWLRTSRPTPWVDDPDRPVIVVAAPELLDDRPEYGPADWRGVADVAHELGAILLAVSMDAAWIEEGHFDGLMAGPIDGSFEWAGSLPDGAWFVPTVTPGTSMNRVGDPDPGQDRAAGGFYEDQWMVLASSSRAIDMIVVVSFNGWTDGTQIEPASPTPPDPRYRTYDPLESNGYLELTREFAERVAGTRG